ncbi:Zinc finger, CCHC-type [Lasallia pustulata]|uniref:Zinc finger, CCHC-type n=1 Tax=Lasallia pustulata TaxID=136370 RepID=A0A1W5D916_9LECA|nr:Zinc finger, CCHC-type [Lasallia pustulata]
MSWDLLTIMSTTGGTQGGSKAAMPRAEVVTIKSFKLATPTIFMGNRKKLDTFLLQLTLYFKFNQSSFVTDADKYTGNEDDPTEAEESTQKMFASFKRFRSEIQMVFRDIDHKCTAERNLLKLRQIKSAADYTAHFTRISAATNWEDAALTAIFYAGLRNGVKDEIGQSTYGNKKKTTTYTSGQKRNKNRHQKNNKYGPKPMEIDTIEPKKKKTFDGDCYNYGKKGHLARDCRGPQQTKKLGKAKKPSHKTLSWIGCYNDNCNIHRSNKEGTGWYPQLHNILIMLKENSGEEPDMWEDYHLTTISNYDKRRRKPDKARARHLGPQYLVRAGLLEDSSSLPGPERTEEEEAEVTLSYLILSDMAPEGPEAQMVMRGMEDLQLSLEKSEFHKQEIDFLGYIIHPRELGMDPNKVTAIQEWPEPKTVKEVQAFLGFANFYRRFIEKYSQKATPLTNLTKKDQPFRWDDKHQYAFETIKEAFANSKVLQIFDPELPTEVETDVSNGALGACLGQQKDKKLVPVAFYSRKLAPAELNYKIHDKELLAIVDALKQWRVYLEGSKTKVKVYLDHKNLKSFTTTKELAAYHFRIYYWKGSLNGQADALSRRADYITDIPKTAGQILEVDADGNLAYHCQQIAAIFEVTDTEGERFIREALTKDKAMKDLCTPNQEPGSPFEYKDGILWFNGKCYVPKSARDWVIRTCHNDRVQGHQGIK